MIELLLYLACSLGTCHVTPLMVTPEAVAVAACESGDTVTLGTYSMTARNHRTNDGGAWQHQWFISGCMTILALQFVMWVWHQQKDGK